MARTAFTPRDARRRPVDSRVLGTDATLDGLSRASRSAAIVQIVAHGLPLPDRERGLPGSLEAAQFQFIGVATG